MRFLILLGLLASVSCIILGGGRDSSFSGSDESYSGEDHHGHGGGNHGHGHGNGNGNGNGNGPRPNPGGNGGTRCEAGWTFIRRTRGGWCIRVFESGLNGNAQAEAACNSYGATLSSVESPQERLRMEELGKQMMTSTSSWKFGTLRLGMIRNSVTAPFQLTDNFTVGRRGIAWSPAEPSSGSTYGYPNNCGFLWIWLPGGKTEGRTPGTMFAMLCPETRADRWRGHVCGKRAT